MTTVEVAVDMEMVATVEVETEVIVRALELPSRYPAPPPARIAATNRTVASSPLIEYLKAMLDLRLLVRTARRFRRASAPSPRR